MTHPHLIPRPAATLILVRDTSHGMEVLMLQRSHQASFIPGGYVFPGGAVDPEDSDPAFLEHVTGMDDARASQLLGVEHGGLTFWIAALRECFEEAGVLLAYDDAGNAVEADSAGTLEQARAELENGDASFLDLCRRFNLRLALDELPYFSHWITQLGAPRRFTTRFFAALAPKGQTASHDETETIHHVWIRPADALAGHRSGEMNMVLATTRTLEILSSFDKAEEFIDHARTIKVSAPLFPRYARRGTSQSILLEGDPAYAEIGKLDCTGTGAFSCEIVPGEVVQISPAVRRMTAPNPGLMTGPGTNTYVLGTGEDFAIIDPGPADEAHIENLLTLTGGRIRWILVTHTHLDHSPAAVRLKQFTGAVLFGMASSHPDRQDLLFQPDLVPEDGQTLELAGCRLRVIHTPGHAANHLCYFLEDESLLFTGDHIMQGSTVVINPPDGDMAAYLQSLIKLRNLHADYIAPGHGFLMDRPDRAIDALLKHRLTREKKIIKSLSANGPSSLLDLVPLAYDDVPEHKHRLASRSLLAHLLKLHSEGRVSESGDRWMLTPDAC
jgi:glyoxylase-like metal-dependent hydrolase (beta-lactamase superfamily II)/8-oxo-dGTP pyrophosphatase MutT (NUDIX family)